MLKTLDTQIPLVYTKLNRSIIMYTLEDILNIYFIFYKNNIEEFIDYLEIENVNPFLIEETKVIISTL